MENFHKRGVWIRDRIRFFLDLDDADPICLEVFDLDPVNIRHNPKSWISPTLLDLSYMKYKLCASSLVNLGMGSNARRQSTTTNKRKVRQGILLINSISSSSATNHHFLTSRCLQVNKSLRHIYLTILHPQPHSIPPPSALFSHNFFTLIT